MLQVRAPLSPSNVPLEQNKQQDNIWNHFMSLLSFKLFLDPWLQFVIFGALSVATLATLPLLIVL